MGSVLLVRAQPGFKINPKSVMSFSLENRVALVTGSSTGLGKAIAFALGRAGARVAFNYFNDQPRAEAAFAEFQATGATGTLVRADVTDPDEVQRLARQVEADLGPIDILVPNATPDQPQKPIEDYDWAFYQSMIDFFIKSPYLLCRACLPHMKQQRWGRIINIITEVYSHRVGSLKDYVDISSKLKDRKDPIAFLVKRRSTSTSTYVPVIPRKE